MKFVALFFAAAFLCNSIPHLVAGLQGAAFPTPFATPRGVGNSPPLVNFLWGVFNACVGIALLVHSPLVIGWNLETLAFLAGVLVPGAYLARHFARVRRGA